MSKVSPPGRESGPAVLTLTREEADALLQLIDIALKATGLSVAQAAVHLASRVVAADTTRPGAAGRVDDP